eukprot:3300987-Amphidinium_carterae.2
MPVDAGISRTVHFDPPPPPQHCEKNPTSAASRIPCLALLNPLSPLPNDMTLAAHTSRLSKHMLRIRRNALNVPRMAKLSAM